MTCRDYFYRILSRKDYSASELLKKGKEKGFEISEINSVIEELQERGYQSDTRLVTNLISASKGKYGKFVIKRKCLEKGINASLFDGIWENQEEEDEGEEISQLDELKNKIMRKYKIEDFTNIEPKTKSKLWNYLQYRGFNPSDLLTKWQKENNTY